jgi:hypothetical protein
MRSDYKMYVDESGAYHLSHYDPNFTLCGIVVKRDEAEELRILADRIKFKYWGHTDIVFHSEDMANKTGDFSIFADPKLETEFNRDIKSFLSLPLFQCIVVSVDKVKAKVAGLSSDDLLNLANDKLIEFFASFIGRQTKGCRGQIILESSSAQDISFYKRYMNAQSRGIPSIKMSGSTVKKMITSLSFVIKGNHDIEEQLADLFAYPATQKFLQIEGISLLTSGSHTEKMCNILWSKLAHLGPGKNDKACVRLPV